MRPVLLFVVAGASCLAVGGGSFAQALAAEDSKDITRVAIVVSGGPVAYTDQLRENPPAIVIEFRSGNVKAQLDPVMAVHSGIVKEIRSEHYPTGRRALKSLTLTLLQPAAYTIAQQANQIVIDIHTPLKLLPGKMSVGKGVTVLGIEARETLVQRLKVMGDALQQAAPPVSAESVKPKPVVVTKPVDIPQPVVQPAPALPPVSRKGRGGFWYGLALGIGGTWLGVARRRKRKVAAVLEEPAKVAPIVPGASVYEQLILKALERQGHKHVGSKAIESLGTVWVVEKEGNRQGLLCLINGEFFERKILEQFHETIQKETLRSGVVYAWGAFTAPAQTFAKECGILLVAREEVWKTINVELKTPALDPAAVAQLARVEGELTRELAEKVELYAKLSQEADQLKAKSAEVDQRLAAEQEKRTQLEAPIAQLEGQLKVRIAAATASHEKEQLVQEVTSMATEVVKEAAKEEATVAPEVGQIQERRKWPRLDLSTHREKGVLVRVTSDDGEPINGDARNVSASGICLELPQGERCADEFALKLFFPNRIKPIEAIGKIVWKGKGTRRRLGQLGVALSAINAPDQEAIKQFVEQRTSELITA